MSRVTQDTARSRSSFEYRIITFYDVTFQILLLTLQVPRRGPTTPAMRCHKAGLGSSPVARHYWGNHCYFLFLEVLRCFSSLRSPHRITVMTAQHAVGLSHSEIPGSKVICTLPGLIAAYHVLHRLREPRHPPCALKCFLLVELPASQKGTEGSAHTFSCMINVLKLQSCVSICQRSLPQTMRIVENIGVEPMTSCMPCKRSSQLS